MDKPQLLLRAWDRRLAGEGGDGGATGAKRRSSFAWRSLPGPVARFDGKVALVTGAASGIGRGCADALEREGARVVRVDLAGTPSRCDVTDAAQVEALGASVGRIDLAVNAAGVEGAIAKLALAPVDDFARVIDVNLTGVFLCMRMELAAGARSIVNVASVAGLIGWRGAAAYTASKHGVVGLTRTAALEVAKAGARVNVVCPGVTRTPMYERMLAQNPAIAERTVAANPAGRIALVEEVVGPILWLLSDDASFVNGVALPVDGGLTAQ